MRCASAVICLHSRSVWSLTLSSLSTDDVDGSSIGFSVTFGEGSVLCIEAGAFVFRKLPLIKYPKIAEAEVLTMISIVLVS